MGVPVERAGARGHGAAQRAHRPPRPARRRQVDARREARRRRSSVPFVELDREVEKEAGAKLGEVFAMYGQDAFRRFERRALERVLDENERAVIATGGSLVTDPGDLRAAARALPLRLAQGLAARSTCRASSPRATCGRFRRRRALGRARRDPQAARRPRAALRARRAALDTSGKTVRQTLQELQTRRSHDHLRNPARPLQPLEARRSTARSPRSRSTSPRTRASCPATS